MRIRMVRGTGYNGQSLLVGEEYEVDEKWGRIFVQLGKAVRVETPPEAVEVREPVEMIQTRDPKVRRR